MKATSQQLKSFLRTCKNAYITIDLGNGPMMVKIIKSAISDYITREEFADSMWTYDFLQTDTGLDIKIGEAEEKMVTLQPNDDSLYEDVTCEENENSYAEENFNTGNPTMFNE